MAIIRRNHFVVTVDELGTLIDGHRHAWLEAGLELPVGHRLTYPRCSTWDCVKPAHGDSVQLTDPGDGSTRAIITAVTPTKATVDDRPLWRATVEASNGQRGVLDLNTAAMDHLGFTEAVDALECEVFITTDGDATTLEPVGEDDPDRPGGRPEWYRVRTISVARAIGACPCHSQRPFANCHGQTTRRLALA